eukprot:1492709-Rhodomonas_salina.5
MEAYTATHIKSTKEGLERYAYKEYYSRTVPAPASTPSSKPRYHRPFALLAPLRHRSGSITHYVSTGHGVGCPWEFTCIATPLRRRIRSILRTAQYNDTQRNQPHSTLTCSDPNDVDLSSFSGTFVGTPGTFAGIFPGTARSTSWGGWGLLALHTARPDHALSVSTGHRNVHTWADTKAATQWQYRTWPIASYAMAVTDIA